MSFEKARMRTAWERVTINGFDEGTYPEVEIDGRPHEIVVCASKDDIDIASRNAWASGVAMLRKAGILVSRAPARPTFIHTAR